MKKPLSLYLLFLLLITSACVRAQSDRQLWIKADDARLNKDWFGASQYYSRLYKRDSSNLRTRYAYAEVSRLNFDSDLALRLYGRVIAEDNGKKFPLAFYWTGQLLKTKGQYKEAKKWFAKFSKVPVKKSRKDLNYFIQKANLEIEACDLAQILMKNPVVSTIEHLDTTINSKVSEYAPFEKDSTLYFSSLRNGKKRDANAVNFNKIYQSKQKNQKWQKVKELDTLINATYLHNANTCFSPDYRQMIVSRCLAINASDYRCELYISAYVNNRWLEFERLPEPINLAGYNTSQPNFGVVNGQTVLFFASNRPGGKGEMDIWYSFRNREGDFEAPVNAGEKINTPENEITPWCVGPKKDLYFSSTYHKGLGSFDIFKSHWDSTGFTEPENAGYPINSSYNDIYYSVNKSADHVYLSSNRIGSFFENKLNCCNDIYRFSMDPVVAPPPPIDTVALVEGQMKLLVPLTLYFHNDEPDPKTKNTRTLKTYDATYRDYKLLLPQYTSSFTEGLGGKEKDAARFAIENFFADSLDAGMQDLDRFSHLLEKTLLSGETVTVTLKGYCSPLASTDYNIILAKRRISSLRNYFSETRNGLFLKYIDAKDEGQARLIFEDVDVGELPVSKASDDFKDKRNSVYSPSAASERKIQVIAVSFGR